MESILLELLRRLETMLDSHPEVNSPEVRTEMDYAVLRGFIQAEAGYVLPQQFGMRSVEGNGLLRGALGDFIRAASELSLATLTERVVAFRNEEVATKLLDGVADFFAPFTTWLAQVAKRPLVVAPNDLPAEADNLVGANRDAGLPVAPSFVLADHRDISQISMLRVWVVKLLGSPAAPGAAAAGGRDPGSLTVHGSQRGRRC